MVDKAYPDVPSAQTAKATTDTAVTANAKGEIRVTAYTMPDDTVEAQIADQPPAVANYDPATRILGTSYWKDIIDKPFNTVDGETLSTEGGVLRFKTGSYEDLTDKPSIEGVTLIDDKTFAELGMEECSILDIEKMFA